MATTVLSGAAFAGWSGGGMAGLVLAGLSYATAILAILFAHEMGHYLLARAWRVDSTFPFFLPIYIPGSLNFGTLGALIRLRSHIPSRDAVLDIGAAGPIAGALVAIPLYAWGLAHSKVHAVGQLAASGTDSLWGMLQSWIQGEPLAGGGGHRGLRGQPRHGRGAVAGAGAAPARPRRDRPPGGARRLARPLRHHAQPHPHRPARRRAT